MTGLLASRELSERGAYLAFRGALFLILAFLLLYDPRAEGSLPSLGLLLLAAYLALHAGAMALPARLWGSPAFQGALFLLDAAAVTGTIHSVAGIGSDLYLLYFLIVFMSGLQGDLRQSFFIGAAACAFHAAVWLRDSGLSFTDPTALLRFPFFFTVSFVTATFADRLRSSEARAEEGRTRARRLEADLAAYEAGKAVFTTLRSAELPPRIVEIARRMFSARDAVLALRDRGGELRLAAAAGPLDPEEREARLRLARRALERGDGAETPVRLSGLRDPRSPYRDLPRLEGAGSALLHPVVLGESRGLLVVLRDAGAPRFAPEEIRGMTILCSQIAQAVENARLVEALDAKMLELGASQERLRLIAENVADLVLVADSEGRLADLNPACEELGDRRGLLGRPLLDLVHPADRERARDRFERTLRSGAVESEEFRLLLADGRVRTVEVKESVAGSDGGRRVVLVARDVSERRLREAQLRQTQKLEAVGRLAAGLAHELKNPLSGVIANGQFLQRELEGEPAQLASAIVGAGRRCNSIINNLLVFSKDGPGDRVPAPAAELLERALALCGRRFELANVEVRRAVAAGLPCRVNPVQVEQALFNILLNALQAMPAGGTLTLRLEAAELDETAAHRLCLPQRGRGEPGLPPSGGERAWARFEVADSGVGIPSACMDRLFEPFFTTKGPDQGTGLGLAVAYEIVHQHGGHVWARSPGDGRGATFTVLLPRVA